MWAQRKQSGFTIVELLIVIVVIGILAAITVVAFNGVTQKAQNAQTTQALTGWIKAMQAYKVENGSWPKITSCLGADYKYGPAGTDTSGVAQCRQTVAGTGFTVNPAFTALMEPYVGGNPPNPSFVTARSTDTMWYRGLAYAWAGGDGTQVYIQATFSGSASPCPTAAGYAPSSPTVMGGNLLCHYTIGSTTDT